MGSRQRQRKPYHLQFSKAGHFTKKRPVTLNRVAASNARDTAPRPRSKPSRERDRLENDLLNRFPEFSRDDLAQIAACIRNGCRDRRACHRDHCSDKPAEAFEAVFEHLLREITAIPG